MYAGDGSNFEVGQQRRATSTLSAHPPLPYFLSLKKPALTLAKIYVQILRWCTRLMSMDPVNTIVVVDSLTTTGGRFEVCKRLILEHYPQATVIGGFLV